MYVCMYVCMCVCRWGPPRSIHWALTQFTPATNNVAPANALERLSGGLLGFRG